MGAAASRQRDAGEAGVLFQSTSIPVSFSDRLAESIESGASGALEGESSRALQIEALVQERVAAELAKLRDQERSKLAQATYDLGRQNLDREQKASKQGADLNAVILEQDLAELKRQVQRRTADGTADKVVSAQDKAVDAARSKVLSCLLKNPDRSLDCHAEVDEFKSAVGKLQKEFIASLS